jgi:hypothetical protein
VTIEQLEALDDASASTPVPFDEAAGWVASVSDRDVDEPTVTVSDTGVRIAAVAHLGSTPTVVGAVGWAAGGDIEAVLPSGVADDLDVAPGAKVDGFVAGTPVTFRMAGATDVVPGSADAAELGALAAGLPFDGRSGSTVVVDGQALAHRLAEGGAAGPIVDEYWGSAVATTTGIVDSEQFGREMMQAPLRAEIPATAVLALFTGLLLALAGFGARAAAVSRSRRLESAQLRALGLSRRQTVQIALADTTGIAVTGILIGVAAGWSTLALVGTRVVTGAAGTSPRLVVPVEAVALVPVALLAALVAVSVAIASDQRRLPLPDLLRAGGDA